MFGNLSLLEWLFLGPIVAIPIVLGWFVVRAWDRRNTATRDLDEISEELAALTEQNTLLAEELAELALEVKATAQLVRPDSANLPAGLDQPRSN